MTYPIVEELREASFRNHAHSLYGTAAAHIQALAEALDTYTFAENIDDPAERLAELSVARQQAERALSNLREGQGGEQ